MSDQGIGKGYSWKIANRPSFSTLQVDFTSDGSIYSEGGSMVYYSNGLSIETKLHGGFFGALGKMLSKESLFISQYRATSPAKLGLSPTMPGDIAHIPLIGNTMRLSASAFLAASEGITISTVYGGCKSLFGRSGLFILEASGTGDLFASGYGIISEETVKGSMTVDTGHLVAWEPSLTYRIKRVGSWKSTLLSGEGLVVEFSGMGKILICSRNVSSLVSWISPWLPA